MEKQTLLEVDKVAYKTIDGVTYFKLKSEFEGDYTKNCGLLGEEIDGNFYFLRGYDIESIELDKDRNLILKRVNKEYTPIKVNISEELKKDEFSFDKETGVITVTYPDGTTSKIEGFLVENQNVILSTDNTLKGDGTMFNPLRLASTEFTGTYAPVEKLVDLTRNIQMPQGMGKGYRVITREKIDNFGCLYPLSAISKIQDKLTEINSQWRVPTKQDWDELLNAMELDPAYRNHNSIKNMWLGQVAGSALKSANMWKDYENLPSEIPTNGQDVVDLSIYPLGIGPNRNEVMNEKDFDLEGFTKLAGMWTNTFNEAGDAYVKLFGYNSSKVDQDSYGEGARMSIRLVKDYNLTNYNEIEYILGLPYPTKLVYGVCEDMPYVKIWTAINVYDSSPGLDGKRSIEWEDVSEEDKGIKIVYFVNEWDGYEWHKKLLKEGDSVVIKEYTNKNFHEWRIINGVLIDTLENVTNEFNLTLEEIYNNINTEKEERQKADTDLLNKIQEESNIRLSAITLLESAITFESETRILRDNQIKEIINSEISNRVSADTEINESIINITKDINNLDNKIDSTESKCNDYADSLSSNYDVAGAAASALTEAKAYTDVEISKLGNVYAPKAEFEEVQKKVDDITSVGGEPNVQSDWNIVDEESDAFIKNKPDLGIYATKEELEGAVSALQGSLGEVYAPKADVETLIGEDVDKSTRTIAAEEVAKIVAGADTKYDTLKEIADWITTDTEGYVALVNKVAELETKISELEQIIANLQPEQNTVKAIIKDYILGVAQEIKVNEENGKLTIGFADDAVFG